MTTDITNKPSNEGSTENNSNTPVTLASLLDSHLGPASPQERKITCPGMWYEGYPNIEVDEPEPRRSCPAKPLKISDALSNLKQYEFTPELTAKLLKALRNFRTSDKKEGSDE